MKPVFVDIHIHTSKNPNILNPNFNVELLKSKMSEITKGNYPILVSLSDHNTVNKQAYLNMHNYFENILLGVELHIRKYRDADPYHCHILFNTEITSENIDKINTILDELYPNKEVCKDFEYIPNIEDISNAFDDFDYMLLPHGGQSHSTFDKSIAKGHKFDNSMERSLYYNHFEGFTARSNSGLEDTEEYFKRIGIDQFTNLITCTDNYDVSVYPNPKDKNAEKYIPTWMLSEPTFDGLRLALSEKTRLIYSFNPPEEWYKTIQKVELKTEKCDIEVDLSPGLNVVIGGSSSGKTLLVDSIVHGINKDFNGSQYNNFEVDQIKIDNPSGTSPHYINQNFIISVFQNPDLNIGDIPIIKEVFPGDASQIEQIRNKLIDVKKLLNKMVDSARQYHEYINNLQFVGNPGSLIDFNETKQIVSLIKPKAGNEEIYSLSSADHERYINTIREIKEIFEKCKLDKVYEKAILTIVDGLEYVNNLSVLSREVNIVLEKLQSIELLNIEKKNSKHSKNILNRHNFIEYVSKAVGALSNFYKYRNALSMMTAKYDTEQINVAEHLLSIEYEFKLSPEIFVEVINRFLKNEYRVSTLSDISPETIHIRSFSDRPKITDYESFSNAVYSKLEEKNVKKYKITTSQGEDFDRLSPGWKSAVILDIVLCYEKDYAPLIIDQPEDNLATDYINHGLVEKIKIVKAKKQVILVSHNATIPMIGDAQNIIVCQNNNGKIYIRSAPLESKIGNIRVLDYIADITDGGKPSIKKRVKKYDLKRYREVAK